MSIETLDAAVTADFVLADVTDAQTIQNPEYASYGPSRQIYADTRLEECGSRGSLATKSITAEGDTTALTVECTNQVNPPGRAELGYAAVTFCRVRLLAADRDPSGRDVETLNDAKQFRCPLQKLGIISDGKKFSITAKRASEVRRTPTAYAATPSAVTPPAGPPEMPRMSANTSGAPNYLFSTAAGEPLPKGIGRVPATYS